MDHRTASRLAIALALVMLSAGCREQAAPTAAGPRATPVLTAVPRSVQLQEPVRALGRLESSNEMRLAFKSPGVVARLHVDIGDAVSAGQLLAELESTELDAAVTRGAEALEKAERDLARARELHGRGLIARELLDNANTARELAAADASAARFNRRFAEIRAAAPGRVLARHVEPREIVAAGAPVLSISAESGGWLLRVRVTEREVVRLGAGMLAQLRFDALPEEALPARITRIAAQADPASAMFEVELALEGAEPRLRSGMIARADIATPAVGSALLVPLAALVDAGEGRASLYVEREGRAELRSVRTGRLLPEGIAVLEGLAPGERVIVGGAAYIDDGQPVGAVAHRD